MSSVSGGSIASAATVGGFADPTADDPDPMGRRVRLLASLVQTTKIATEETLSMIRIPAAGLLLILVLYFLGPDSATAEDTFLKAGILIVPTFGLYVLAAIVHSWYAVQSAVETLVAEARGTLDQRDGTSLQEIAADEPTMQRIFCATDLSSGSHVYVTPDHVLVPGRTGRRAPSAFLADVVAASACFPGFRPVVFRRDELGLTESANASPAKPRRHSAWGRLLLGIVGAVGVAMAVGAVLARMLGLLDAGWIGLGIVLALLALGCGIAYLSARTLRRTDDEILLVDGGVCDNLGAAFALLAKDDRYAELPAVAGTDEPGLMLVVDASKPFTEEGSKGRGLGELIPLRWRGAQRSVLKLLGNANAAARKHVIQLVLRGGGPIAGAVVSIGDLPEPVDEPGEEWDVDRRMDWPAIVQTTTATPTTLSALDFGVVWALLLQSYRLTQSKLAEHGVELIRERTSWEILNDLVIPKILAEEDRSKVADMVRTGLWPKKLHGSVVKMLRQTAAKGAGPYARLSRRVDGILWTVGLAGALGLTWLVIVAF